MKTNIEQALKKHYRNAPPPDPAGIEQTLARAQKVMPAAKYPILPLWRFLFSQFSFIRKRVWLAQFLVVLACGLTLFLLPREAKTIALISAAAPLIVLTNVFELSRSYTHGMVEIELSTRYSFRQLMLARLSVLGAVDILCLTVLLIFSGMQISVEKYAIILYAFVPFLATCFACLLILNRIKRRESTYYCAAVGLCITFAIGIATMQYPQIFELAAIWAWAVIFIFTFTGMICEVRRMLKNCDQKLNTVRSII